MSQLSKNLTLALFLFLILSFRSLMAGECRLEGTAPLSGRVFCDVRMELWVGGASESFINSAKEIQGSAKSPADYPEELTRPLNTASWIPLHH